uniref:Uncharacterized protein n=1 Tax=Anguilla anguilla TaxID=7936 RepID=A0A0E9WG59_ANGAN
MFAHLSFDIHATHQLFGGNVFSFTSGIMMCRSNPKQIQRHNLIAKILTCSHQCTMTTEYQYNSFHILYITHALSIPDTHYVKRLFFTV